MTEEELQQIISATDIKPAEQGFWSRLGEGALMAPIRAINNIDESIANWIGGTEEEPSKPEDLQALQKPEARGLGQGAAELAGAIAPIAIETYLTGRVMSPITNPLKAISPVGAEVVKDAVTFGLLGGSDSRDLGMEQAAEGGAYGLLSALPRKYRLPLAAGVAALSKGYFDRKDDSEVAFGATKGDINAGMGFLTAMIPSQRPILNYFANAAKSEAPLLLRNAAEELKPVRRPVGRLGNGMVEGEFNYVGRDTPPMKSIVDSADWEVVRDPTELDPIKALKSGPNEVVDGVVYAGYEGKEPQRMLQYFNRHTPKLLPEPRIPSIEEIKLSIPDPSTPITPPFTNSNSIWNTPSLPIPKGKVEPEGNVLLTNIAKAAETNSAGNVEASATRVKGKLRQIPEYKTTQGGFVLPELNAALTRAAIGSAIGAGVGSMADEGDSHDNLLAGAIAFGAAAAFGPELMGSALKTMSSARAPQVKTPIANFAKSWGTKVEEMAGRGFKGSAHVMDRFVRMLDSQLGLTLPPSVKGAILKAKGAADFYTHTIDTALKKVGLDYQPSKALKDLANDFLDSPSNPTSFIQQASILDPKGKEYASLIVTARESITSMQRMALDGISDPKQAKIVADSLDKYMKKSYRLFSSDSWHPDEATVDRLVARMQADQVYPNASDATVRSHLKGYLREAKMQNHIYGQLSPESQKIGQSAFIHRKNMSQEWKDFLGEIDNPQERILHTVFRVRPLAEAGRSFATLAKMDLEGGIPAVFDSYGALDTFRTNLESVLANSTDPNQRIMISKQLTSLDSYHEIKDSLRNGSLAGKVASRGVHDALSGIDALADPMNPLVRSMAKFNSVIKTGRTLLNPITMVRNYLTAPAMMGIARVNVARDVPEAFKILTQDNHPMLKEIFDQGIMNADQIKGELIGDFKAVYGNTTQFSNALSAALGLSNLDSNLASKVASKGMSAISNAYRLPDSITRVAAYLSAKTRFAAQMGLPDSAPEVMEAARKFTERYTMNYAAVSHAVRTARNVPFTSLFMSYSAEAGRIMKNLAEDVIKGSDGVSHGRLYAAAPLAILTLGPSMLSASSESGLSAKDKEDWSKAQSLMPHWQQDQNKILIGRKDKGEFDYVDLSPILPTEAYNKMFANIAKGDAEGLAMSNPFVGLDNSPAMSIAASMIMGQDFRTHKQIRSAGDFAALVAREVLPPIFPTGAEFQKIKAAYTPNDSGGVGVTSFDGTKLTPSEVWTPYYTGLRVSSSNLQTLQKRAVARAKNEIADEVSYLRKILQSDARADVKAKATENAKQSIQVIQAALRVRLSGDYK